MNKLLWGLVGAVLLILVLWFVIPAFATVNYEHNGKVTICHWDNGQGGKWNQIDVDTSAVNGQGNGDHNDSQHQQGKDIIPPGSWDNNGRNWDSTGQAIWNNDCEVPVSPTVTPSVTPSVTPQISVSPTVTPTFTVTPTAEPSATLTPEVEHKATVTEAPLQDLNQCTNRDCSTHPSPTPNYPTCDVPRTCGFK